MAAPGVAPVLSTPDTHIFEEDAPALDFSHIPRLSDVELAITYEVQRTISEIRAGRWKRIALQFPDEMLLDSIRIYEALSRGLASAKGSQARPESEGKHSTTSIEQLQQGQGIEDTREEIEKLFILGDTSYGACCVDEVAAEHVDADVVVHYGRSCLSPTARLPVIYVFTTRKLDLDAILQTFVETYPERDKKVILMADVPYHSHVAGLQERLTCQGYTEVFATEVIHNPSSPLPNRTVPSDVQTATEKLRDYDLFHISKPPKSLLLTLSSRVKAIHIFPTDHSAPTAPTALLASSGMALRRRYALLTSLSTVAIFGILINTLSVKNYLHVVEHVRDQIKRAGKKSYTFVVGKINAAKVANFSEVGGWIVIGCWESSLIEGKDFWKPIITPFELALALQSDAERVWTGEWSSDFQAILEERKQPAHDTLDVEEDNNQHSADRAGGNSDDDADSEEESAPPEFDLRTGRYVSHSRPMPRKTNSASINSSLDQAASKSLVKRANGDVAQIGGVLSPGADFLRSHRTWQGLGSDFEISYENDEQSSGNGGALVEEGRSGVARGYVVGDDRTRT
jgi:diphthamide biosynthesis protein 2